MLEDCSASCRGSGITCYDTLSAPDDTLYVHLHLYIAFVTNIAMVTLSADDDITRQAISVYHSIYHMYITEDGR
jgi:hypothetical protein